MPRNDPRSVVLPIRLTTADRDRLAGLASSQRRSLSDTARQAIQVACNSRTKPECASPDRDHERPVRLAILGETLAELRRIGGLYAMQAKTGRVVPPASQATLDAAVASVRAAITGLLS